MKKGFHKKKKRNQNYEEIKNTAQEVNEKEVFPRSEKKEQIKKNSDI